MLKRCLLFTAGLLLPFALGEWVLQAFDPYHFGEKEDWTQYTHKVIDSETHRLRPGATATYLGKTTTISAQGWRSPDFAVPKPEGVYRILLLGGSVPYGWGVADGEEFPRILERRLNAEKRAGDRRIEVINTGVPAWKMVDAGRFLLAEGLAMEPDMVLLTLVATDVLTERQQEPRGALFNNAIRRLRLARALENRYRYGAPGSQGQSYDAYANLSAEGLRAIAALLEQFQRVCQGAGARFVVFDTLGREITRARCAQAGIHRIEGYTTWERRRAWEVAVTDAHPNAEGHRALAELILAGLVDGSLWEKR